MPRPDRAADPAPPSVTEGLFCAGLAGLLDAAAGWRTLPDVRGGAFSDPDSPMRLLRLAETLRAGAPVDAIAHDQSGAGFILHWSHLLDMLLLLVAQPLRLLFPAAGPEAADAPLPAAVHWAAVLSGPLSVAALAAAVLRAVSPFAARSWRWIVAPALAVAWPVAAYGMPGVVHHHVLLAAMVAMAAGWAARVPASGSWAGWKLGLWAGAGIWLSPEAMPFALLAFGGVGWLWLLTPRDPAPRRALLAIGPGLLLVLLLAVAVDPGSGPERRWALDHVSFLFVALAFAVCVIGAGAWALDRVALRPPPRAAAAMGMVAVVLGLWLLAFPAVLGGTEGAVSAPEARAIFARIDEMRPIDSPGDALRALTGGTFAAVALSWLAWRRRSWRLAYVALCGVVLVGLGAWHRRFSTYEAALGAAMLAVVLGEITRSRIGETLGGALARVGCIAPVLFVPILPDIYRLGTQGAAAVVAENGGDIARCSIRHIAALMAPYAGQVVLAELNDSPDLLYRTGVLTVGSLYLRAGAGAARALAAWSSPGDTATEPDAVRATGATLVLTCPGRDATDGEDTRAEDTLFERLRRNAPPPWLARVGADAAGHVLYQVRTP